MARALSRVFPAKVVKPTGHLDLLQVNRAVLLCFSRESAKVVWHVLDVLSDGDM